MRKMPVLLINLFTMNFVFENVFADSASFQYFGGKDIDYWNEGKLVRNDFSSGLDTNSQNKDKNSLQSHFSGSTTIRGKDSQPFSWSNYQNPQKPEFWDDGGDWIPPRPFREAASNPTKENIDAYLNWMQKKSDVVTRFQSALTAHVLTEAVSTSNPQNEQTFDWRRAKIIYLYQTSCSHCRASAPVIENAKKMGAKVVFIQLDASRYPPLHAGSMSANNVTVSLSAQTKNILSHVNSTPTWIFEGNQHSIEMTGELTFSELSRAAKQFFSGVEI